MLEKGGFPNYLSDVKTAFVYHKSTHMKNNMKPSFYYSPYPLKAIERAVAEAKNGEPSPRLKALLGDDSKPRTRIRVHPMTNPYKSVLNVLRPRTRKAKDIEPDGKDWFHHYE